MLYFEFYKAGLNCRGGYATIGEIKQMPKNIIALMFKDIDRLQIISKCFFTTYN